MIRPILACENPYKTAEEPSVLTIEETDLFLEAA